MTTMTDLAIRPFEVHVPEEDLIDLGRRIAATRWPRKELVADRSQGVQLATIQQLARYWATDYDWRTCEARLNALPQFKTEIDGVDIHFIHLKSPHDDALPLIMTHGWPGSVIELLEVVGPLTDPTAYGGSAGDAFDLVLPSLPGYGFVALAAWMLDHDTDSYQKITRAFVDGQPAGGLTRVHVVDNITLYWLTGTGTSAARSYWDGGRAAALAAGQVPPEVKIPVGFTTFPGEIFQAPRSWVEQSYPSLNYFHGAAEGGHFAAWEEPGVFSAELRAAFSYLR